MTNAYFIRQCRLTEREAETSQAGWSWSCTDPHHLPGLHQPPHPSIPDPDSIPWGAGCGRPELQVAKALLCPGFPHLSIYHRHGTRSTGDVWVTTWEQTPPCPLGDCSPASTCRSFARKGLDAGLGFPHIRAPQVGLALSLF